MNKRKGYMFSFLFYIIASFGVSLTIKASIGVSAVNSTIVALSEVLSFKVGTVMIGINLLFLFGYMILTKFKFPIKYMLQGALFLLFGSFVNLYLYELLIHIDASSYFIRFLFLIIGVVITGLSVGMVIHYNLITFPIESFCMELGNLTDRKFAFYRYGIDILSAVTSISLSLSFNLPLFLREGTIVSMILLTASMSFSKNKMRNNYINN
jgi:uncharacterized membrane protein YczE